MRLLAGEELRAKPWRLVLAGIGPAEEALKTLASELDLTDRVCFCGFVADLPAWMKAIDFLVLPSLIEGFGYVLAEAMAASRPVAAYGASSIPEVVHHGVGGLIAPAKDDDSLTPILARLIDDPALREDLGAKGHDDVRARLSLDTMLDTMEEIVARAHQDSRQGGARR
jgi:glycosyltransferase involved in cell wall biosynthesis